VNAAMKQMAGICMSFLAVFSGLASGSINALNAAMDLRSLNLMKSLQEK